MKGFSILNMSKIVRDKLEGTAWWTSLKMSINFLKEICLPLCPLECNTTIYPKRITKLELRGETLVDYINEHPNLTSDFVSTPINAMTTKQRVAQVNIFYYSLTYMLSYETPKMDVASLLSSMGGNMGLFLGVSVFSLCEMIELLIEIIFILKKKETN